MKKIHPNPKVELSSTINGADLARLRNCIEHITGLKYGYMPLEMIDTETISFRLTLCGYYKKGVAWKTLVHVQTAIEAFIYGQGFGICRVSWDESF